MENQALNKYPKRLAAFDFDHTVVDENTDIVIEGLIKDSIHFKKLIETDGWTRYMQEVFISLNKLNIDEEMIRKNIRDIKEVPGMIKCLKELHCMNFDLIIISDSNTVFIDEWISSNNINIFTKIFTNPAHFTENGLLKIEPFQYQTHCKMSATNLCKNDVLQNFIKKKLHENIKYENVFYVGDGTNDICPIIELSINDYGCVRNNYSMEKRLKQNSEIQNKIAGHIIKWTNGIDLLEEIINVIK